MLTDLQLRGQIESVWDKLWTGGLSNPLDAIEQFSYLLFMKRLDDLDTERERLALLAGRTFTPTLSDPKQRWSYWTKLNGAAALQQVRDSVFPALRSLGGSGSGFRLKMANAEFKINKASVLIEVCGLIDQMNISQQNQDVQGDLYEYLLSKLSKAGRNAQFRTPRHIIRLIVQMIAPNKRERICDPAAGTGGFLVNAYQYILETNTSPGVVQYDPEGMPHNPIGDLLDDDEQIALQEHAFTGYDNDSGMTMLRIGSMNMVLHGIREPRFEYADTLSKGFDETGAYDIVLANPPFKGAIDSSDVGDSLPKNVSKTEILFLHLFLRMLEAGGRCASIVPYGILFRTGAAYLEIRRRLVEDNRLDAVVSMPPGVFRPYAGVGTAVLIFTKNARTERVWFYDMEHDGFTLDDKRDRSEENDIPDIVECWRNRLSASFTEARMNRSRELEMRSRPLRRRRLELEEDINRLTYESVLNGGQDPQIGSNLSEASNALETLDADLAPIQREMNRLNRQFLVSKEQLRSNKYDLTASAYREIGLTPAYYESPLISISRLQSLDRATEQHLALLLELLEQ